MVKLPKGETTVRLGAGKDDDATTGGIAAGVPAGAQDSHTSSDPSSDAPTQLAVDPAVVPNVLGDPTVPDTGNDNPVTVVPGTDPYTGSAAQLGDANLGDSDVQWPPGAIDTAAGALAITGAGARGIDAPGRTDPDGPHPVVAAMDARAEQDRRRDDRR